MKRALILLLAILSLAGCSSKEQVMDGDGMFRESYQQITQDEAKVMMAKDDGHVIVDVRRQDEYDAGHIPGAILIPNESIDADPPEALPDYDQIILVYCRSGNRSKQAAQKLTDMGYRNIYEFGGIIDWTGEIVTTTPVRAISAFSLYRYGDIAYDSYVITSDKNGYYVSINDEPEQPIDAAVADALMQVIDTYDVSSWDGFSETNEFVLDGEGFWLDFTLTDGTAVHASGENAFPEHYFEAMGEMWNILMNGDA